MAEPPRFKEPEYIPGDHVVDVRCPAGPLRSDGSCRPGALLLKLHQSGDAPTMVQPNNLMELQCPECTRRMRKRGRNVARVLHRYDFAGTLIETLIVED